MTDRELMQQVEQYIRPGAVVPVDMQTTQLLVNVLRTRLAQHEPEPVAYSDIISDGGLDPRNKFDTTPPQREWQGLEIDEVEAAATLGIYKKPLIEFARAIEAKLKEKNSG
jgi:hypothetical protein